MIQPPSTPYCRSGKSESVAMTRLQWGRGWHQQRRTKAAVGVAWHELLKEKFFKQPKPILLGLKMMAVCCAETGYLLNLQLEKNGGECKDEIMFRA